MHTFSQRAIRGEHSPQSAKTALRVAVLVNNPCITDSRVIRESEALADSGKDVLVLARCSPDAREDETKNNVRYRRLKVRQVFASKRREDWSKYRLQIWMGATALSFLVTMLCLKWFVLPARQVLPHSTQHKITGNSYRLARLPVRAAFRAVNKIKAHFTGNSYRLARPPERAAFRVANKIKAYFLNRNKRIVTTVVTGTGVELLRHARIYTKPAIAWRPDIVHAHDLYTLFAGYRIARKTGARLIYDSHELELGRNGLFSKWELWLRAQSEAFLIKRSDAVITVCDSIADFLTNHYAIEPPTVIFNAPSIGARDVNHTDIRNHLQLPPETPLAISVGKMTTNRGIENCMRALVHDAEIHLACIGPRVQMVEDAVLSEASRLGVSDRLHLVDQVPHHQVTSFVSSADLSLITIQDVCLSYRYCFPNKLLESLMAGLPIVVSRLPELEGMVAKTGAGVVTNETDPLAIAQSMRQILSNRQAYVPTAEQIGKLQAEYGWPAQIDKLHLLYERLGGRDQPETVSV